MDQFEFGGAIAWRPSSEYIERSRLVAFMRKHGLGSLDELMDRSTTDLEWFWRAVMDDLGIEFYEPYTRVLDLSPGIARPRWCIGGRMNIVHNCLEKWARTSTAHRDALRWEGEEGTTRTMTYGELLREVNRAANGLRALGVRPRRQRRPVHADVPGARGRVLRGDQGRRHRAAALLRVRRRCRHQRGSRTLA